MRVLLVGDTHGNRGWLDRVFTRATDEHADAILQVGDFGWWPRNAACDPFLETARGAPVPLWWIDGNHEDHHELATVIARAGGPDQHGRVALGGALAYLPRGARLDLEGVSVVVCGGAHSIDRRMRGDGITWFDEEHVSDAEIERCTAGGHADILVSHDAPDGWAIPNLPSDAGLPRLWQVELPACHAHRARVGQVFAGVTPDLVVHGHYHSGYRTSVERSWGNVQIVGLSIHGREATVVDVKPAAGVSGGG